MRRRGEIAIIKALGMENHRILISIVMQSGILTLIGFLIAVLFAYSVIPYIPLLVPQLTLVVSFSALAQLGLIALIVAILGALTPAWFVTRLEPASTFHV